MKVRVAARTCFSAVAAGLFCLLSLCPAVVSAQTQVSTILGQVKDENGGVLPGVTLTLRGPALQVSEIVTVTDAQGDYRISPLPIGTFTLQFELGGFQSVRLEGITLTSGFTATLNQTLKIGTVTETITVSGQSPLVDVTQATTATSLQGDSLALIPSGNNGIVGFLMQVPGVRTNIDVGGSSITDTNLLPPTVNRAINGRCSRGCLPPHRSTARAARTTTSTRSKKDGSRRVRTRWTIRCAALASTSS